MEETIIEILVGMLARAGILASHAFEFTTGTHTVALVAILWSIEELIDLKVSSRHIRHKHSDHIRNFERRMIRKLMAHWRCIEELVSLFKRKDSPEASR